MGFILESADLLSRKLRVNSIAQNFDNLLGDNGATETVTKFKDFLKFADAKADDGDSLIDKIVSVGKGIIGLVVGFIKGTINFVKLFGFIISAIQYTVNFNFAASDRQLENQLKANNIALAAAWGGAVGSIVGSVGAIALGYGVTCLLPVITPAMGKEIAFRVIKEDFPELLDEVNNALYQTAVNISKWVFTKSFIGLRRLLRGIYNLTTTGSFWYNEIPDGKRWTIAEAIEEGIENFPGGDAVQAFFEEMAEEAWEKFIETGFIFARELDTYFEQTKAMKQELLGADIAPVIELDPDSNERLYLPAQPTQLAKQQVLQTITTFRQIRNRDIGYFTGEPVKEESRRFNYLRTGKVIFRGNEKPPFGNSKESTISLKDLKSGLKWRDFKTALRPYNWGNHYVWITLNRSRHEIGAWFSTIEEGKNYLIRLVDLLIDDDYIAIDSKTEVERNRYVKKTDDFQLMYPAFITITIKTPVTDREDATHDLAGNSYEKDLNKVPLWTDREPPIDGLNNTEFLT